MTWLHADSDDADSAYSCSCYSSKCRAEARSLCRYTPCNACCVRRIACPYSLQSKPYKAKQDKGAFSRSQSRG